MWYINCEFSRRNWSCYYTCSTHIVNPLTDKSYPDTCSTEFMNAVKVINLWKGDKFSLNFWEHKFAGMHIEYKLCIITREKFDWNASLSQTEFSCKDKSPLDCLHASQNHHKTSVLEIVISRHWGQPFLDIMMKNLECEDLSVAVPQPCWNSSHAV